MHTPGPWIAGQPSSIVGWPVVASNQGRVICNVNYAQHSKIGPSVAGDRAFNMESAANARLIAAAPDLLEALKDLIWQFGATTPEGAAAKEKARAAIAKASPSPQTKQEEK